MDLDNEVLRTVEEYKLKLAELGIRPQRVILYGSYARGTPDRDSDLDLLVISEDFEGMGLWDRLSLLGSAHVNIDRPMEMMGMTPAEVEGGEVSSFVKNEILARGVQVGRTVETLNPTRGLGSIEDFTRL